MNNILLITLDALRADRLGAYGHDRRTSPTIDRVADRGTVFERAHSVGCTTKDSFPGLLSSAYPFDRGGYLYMSDERTMLAEALAEHGYTTIGISNNGHLSRTFNYHRGFDVYHERSATPVVGDHASPGGPGSGAPSESQNDGPLDNLRRTVVSAAERHVPKGTRTHRFLQTAHDVATPLERVSLRAEEVTDIAIDHIERGVDEPFFLWVHYMDPHHPYNPPNETLSEVGASTVDRFRRRIANHKLPNNDASSFSRREIEMLTHLYDGEIRFADRQIDRLLSRLDAEGLRSETVVSVVADHGEGFGEHGEMEHIPPRLYDELTHVPWIIDPPDGTETDRVKRVVSTLDLGPTLLDLVGIDSPKEFDGRSLRPLLCGDGSDLVPSKAISEVGYNVSSKLGTIEIDTDDVLVSYRTDHQSFIHDDRGGRELYDTSTDPGETAALDADRHDRSRLVDVVDERLSEIRTSDIRKSTELGDTEIEQLEALGYI